MSKWLAAVLVLGLSPLAHGQDDLAELKARILEKVRAKLSTDRSALLKRIEKIIDDELSKNGPAAKALTAPAEGDKVKDLERKMRQLEEQKESLQSEMAKAKRLAADEPLREEAKKDGPHGAEDAHLARLARHGLTRRRSGAVPDHRPADPATRSPPQPRPARAEPPSRQAPSR